MNPEHFGAGYIQIEEQDREPRNYRNIFLLIKGKDEFEWCPVPSLSFMRLAAFQISESDKCAAIMWSEQLPPYRENYSRLMGLIYCNGYYVADTTEKPGQLYHHRYDRIDPEQFRSDLVPSQALLDRVTAIYNAWEQKQASERRERLLKAASIYKPDIKNSQPFDRKLAVDLVKILTERNYYIQTMQTPYFMVQIQTPEDLISTHHSNESREGEDTPCVALLECLSFLESQKAANAAYLPNQTIAQTS